MKGEQPPIATNPYRDLFYFTSISRAPVVVDVVDTFRGRPTDRFIGPILTLVGLVLVEQLPWTAGRSIECKERCILLDPSVHSFYINAPEKYLHSRLGALLDLKNNCRALSVTISAIQFWPAWLSLRMRKSSPDHSPQTTRTRDLSIFAVSQATTSLWSFLPTG